MQGWASVKGAVMATLEVGNMLIGEGRPKAIVSIMDTDAQGLMNTCERALHDGADLLEWRADFWPDGSPDALSATCRFLAEALASKAPFIFTYRTKGQGGQVEVTREQYRDVLSSVIVQGKPNFVDIELWVGDDAVRELVDLAHQHGALAIVSHHDFESTPSVDQMESLLLHMADLGADVPKLAVMAQRSQDAHDLMRATHQASEQVGVPLLTMAMGTAGQTTRLTGEVFGSAMTFCALGRASAPGQVELSQALATLEAIHRTRA